MKKALSVFAIIVFLLAGCSKTSDKEYMDKAAKECKRREIFRSYYHLTKN